MCSVWGKNSHTLNYYSTIPASCKQCGKTLKNVYAKQNHMCSGHLTAIPCTICEKLVKQPEEHMRTWHTDLSEKKYKCEQCDKGFMTTHALKP